MLQPKRQKYRRLHRGRGKFEGSTKGGSALCHGSFGLKALTRGEISSRQIEAARRVISKYTKRGGKVWVTIFPHTPITKKAAEVPMGGGKGSPELFVTLIKPGRVLFEMDGLPEEDAVKALKSCGYKLPVKCKVINKLKK